MGSARSENAFQGIDGVRVGFPFLSDNGETSKLD